ncbi:putative integral membrane protein [Actinoplanes missouriensis 431]|uniref:Putative integral membrane protein n=1 Tax=Actinoplanes missouriensis (strain ATCC 14538 / DSM 43046 / CBS 188.64 / JCM 3121 / NBRC 102363 / NCIMB 12654 / NRRL B-3342 / UNCC 431) TaxID=512565 RepID=I0H3J4_ACTM4|nr:EamA family transporter [Actinoplanes missouriensis]BAL87581.1 putative integral membrane protein [Actinoplanes missouriensis 431]
MGPTLCLLSAVCFGALGVFGKLAFEAGVSPDTLLLVRFGLAALLLASFPLLRRRPEVRTKTPGTLLAAALGLGALGYAAQATLYFEALQRMDASLLSLVFYLYPLLVTVTAVALGRDRLTGGKVVALLAASAGVLLVLLGAGGVAIDGTGVALAFGSALTYTGYILCSDRVVRRMPPVRLTTLVLTGAAAALAVRALVAGGVGLDFRADGWLWLTGIVLVSTVLPIVAFFAGLRRTGPSTAAILSTAEPVVTTALAAALLGETLTITQLTGGLLVLSSVVILQRRTGRIARPAGSLSSARFSKWEPRWMAYGTMTGGAEYGIRHKTQPKPFRRKIS